MGRLEGSFDDLQWHPGHGLLVKRFGQFVVAYFSQPIAEIMQVRSSRVTPALLRHPAILKSLNLLTPVLVTYVSHLFILRIHYGKSLPLALAYENVGIS